MSSGVLTIRISSGTSPLHEVSRKGHPGGLGLVTPVVNDRAIDLTGVVEATKMRRPEQACLLAADRDSSSNAAVCLVGGAAMQVRVIRQGRSNLLPERSSH